MKVIEPYKRASCMSQSPLTGQVHSDILIHEDELYDWVLGLNPL